MVDADSHVHWNLGLLPRAIGYTRAQWGGIAYALQGRSRTGAGLPCLFAVCLAPLLVLLLVSWPMSVVHIEARRSRETRESVSLLLFVCLLQLSGALGLAQR